MKKLLLLALVNCSVIHTDAQNSVTITPAATVTVAGSATITLDNLNLVNNGTFTPGNSDLRCIGNTTTTIGGSSTTNFYQLSVANTAAVNLDNNITILYLLDAGGMMNLKSNKITVDPLATLSTENNTMRLTDDAGNIGFVRTEVDLSAPSTNVNPGNIGVEFVSAPELGNTTITRYVTAFVLAGSSAGLINRYYDIAPAKNTALNASVRFNYLDAELNTVNENTAVLWKSNNGGLSWSQIVPDARNTTANWLQKNNVNDFSLWTIGTVNTVLPVIISSFNSICKTAGAELVWTTQTETNSYAFEVEKSTDGIVWTSAATLPAHGNAGDYQFTDTRSGSAFYRLKQIDKNRNFTYSSVIKTNCTAKSFAVILYPDPATDYTQLEFNSTAEGKAIIQIYSSNGQLVQSLNSNINKGLNTIRINIAALSKGVYMIKINGNQLNEHKTFIKE